MNCAECEDLFAALIEGATDEPVTREVEAHLVNCAACGTAMDRTRRLVDRLNRDGQSTYSPPIEARVMDRILQKQTFQLRTIRTKRIAKFSLAALFFVGACIGILWLVGVRNGGRAHAADALAASKQMKQVKTATWKTNFYQRGGTTDNEEQDQLNKSLDRLPRQFYYKSPGRYRDETRNEDGDVIWISIEDSVRRTQLDLDVKNKQATIRHLWEPSYGLNGPFASVQKYLESDNLEWIGKKQFAGREANGFRHSFWFEPTNRYQSYDFWVDEQSKQLVAHQVPGVDILDPEKGSPAGMKLASGKLSYDILFGVELDDSLFSHKVPEGYTLRVVNPPEFTEQKVIEFLGVVAAYFDNTFPDRMPGFLHGAEADRYRKIEDKPTTERTSAQNKLVETMTKYKYMWVPGPGPLNVFIHHQIDEGSWKYIGKGVRLGDKSRVVCWYKPRNSNSYRVVYGDLSVKDVAIEKLPLPVD